MASFEELRDLYHEYTGVYTGDFAMVEAFTSLPVEWQGDDDQLEGFLDFMDIFSFADIEPGHDKEYWDELVEAFEDYYGVTDQGIDWDLLRAVYDARHG